MMRCEDLRKLTGMTGRKSRLEENRRRIFPNRHFPSESEQDHEVWSRTRSKTRSNHLKLAGGKLGNISTLRDLE